MQSRRADDTSAIPGVLCCGVPGGESEQSRVAACRARSPCLTCGDAVCCAAGGFDALFAIVAQTATNDTRRRVEETWASWTRCVLCVWRWRRCLLLV